MIEADKRKAIFLLHQEGMRARQIARRLRVSPNTVRIIIQQEGAMSRIERSDKQRIDPEFLREVYEQCDGRVQRMHTKLVEEQGIAVKYSTLTQMLRELGISKSQKARFESSTSSEYWFTEILNGARPDGRLIAKLEGWGDLDRMLNHTKHGRARQRKKAATIIARKLGISNTFVAKALHSSGSTTRRYFRIYSEAGADGLFAWNTSRKFTDVARDTARTNRLLELLHNKPASYGINRTSWTQPSLFKAYEQTFGEKITRSTFTRLLQSTRYRWRKARKVLTSPDPRYHEKVELLLKTLHSLSGSEMFFFLDEWGPVQVKKRGGKTYREKTDATAIPRRQTPRGTVSLVGALSATTNCITWQFVKSKDSQAMMNLLEILYNQYQTKTKLYVTWDAVAWHNSSSLLEALDQFNEQTRNYSAGPIIELVALPTSAQFLNVIEGVLSAMTKAVINNSDYPSPLEMKRAISTHFNERNDYFKSNPKRAGRKIWEMEFFQNFDSLRSGDYRDW
jgi:transposase